MCRHGHNSSCAVRHQDIIRNPDRNFFSIDRIDRRQAVNADARFFFCKLCALKIRLMGSLLTVCLDFIPVIAFFFIFFQNRVFRGNNHICYAKKRIAAGRINAQLFFFQPVPATDCKVCFCTLGFSNPVFLLRLHPFNIINILQAVYQLVRIIGDFQHPFAFYLAHNRRAAAFAHTVYHFFVCEADLAAGTPVNRHFFFIGESCLKQL